MILEWFWAKSIFSCAWEHCPSLVNATFPQRKRICPWLTQTSLNFPSLFTAFTTTEQHLHCWGQMFFCWVNSPVFGSQTLMCNLWFVWKFPHPEGTENQSSNAVTRRKRVMPGNSGRFPHISTTADRDRIFFHILSKLKCFQCIFPSGQKNERANLAISVNLEHSNLNVKIVSDIY